MNSFPEINTENDTRKLYASTALLIFLLYYLTQLFAGVAASTGLSAGFILFTGHGTDEPEFRKFAEAADPFLLIIASIASAFVLFFAAKIYASGLITKRTCEGIALHHGSMVWILRGFVFGLAIASVYSILSVNLFPPPPDTEFGPLTELALSGGLSMIVWLILALAFAPFIEEFLFRGVLFAGFYSSLGKYASSVLTSLIFVIVHIPESLNYLPALGAIALLAVCNVVLRIKTNSLGPAIAAHFGYNLFVVILILKFVER